MKNRSSGFTIVELVVVMTIILILAGLITGAAQKAKERAMVVQTRAMISGLEMALGMFQTDLGGYPDSGNANLVTALTAAGGTYTIVPTAGYPVTTTAGWSGPYMNFRQGDLSGGSVVDAWGTAMTYSNPGSNHGAGLDYSTYVDISSNGPDKNAGTTGDNVTNWSK